ncbi:hypothetical protein GPY51_14960 [Photorhabdus laumondii subsp. laumondii]|uniref:E14 prophage n=1 Tax=Photorhabdus laumondii subsp. laumondii TaxID=141679 RepID=A0A6L9JMU4_PHOLM|nr:hypothetical protein [Photorhabdus laumondii]MCC8385142.1 hypothetical protein [Photorhabdus laumondii]MCC8413921.1 hypothetical protein [Photorhabdus laumondii]NDK92713.1 hypothetical protein [Photorhabdus laumondii subsp. laumondii]NDL19951.1 hypothetical protein [Photorhabdus laumondii subsp. laumondii]NDL30849.1 hypothetical protein [Photorhabdus laumondii subsp. laumondii]
MKTLIIIAMLVGIAGACLLSFGAWLLLPAAGYLVAGALCLGWSYLVSRMMGQTEKPDKGA